LLPVYLQEGESKCKKEVAAELGCVTPYIIVPGDWTVDDLNYYIDELLAAGAQRWPQLL
jgi:hypothetical protein